MYAFCVFSRACEERDGLKMKNEAKDQSLKLMSHQLLEVEEKLRTNNIKLQA